MRYDVDRLRADANAFDVASAIGMEIRRTGSVVYTECVSGEHSETRINHNQLFVGGCHCYSCGAHYDVFEMVMRYCNVSFYEACGIIADVCGLRENYIIKSEPGKSVKPVTLFSKEELEALGWSKVRRPRIITSFASSKQELPESDRAKAMLTADGYVISKPIPYNMISLYNEDKEAFKSLVLGKCVEKWGDYVGLLYDLDGNDDITSSVRKECEERLNSVKMVYSRYSGVPVANLP